MLPIPKTPKCYVGGAFIRSESGAVAPLHSADGAFLCNIPQCTRKDLRNAVEAAAKAGSWAKRTAYNKGQILYRLAEMLESRAAEMAAAISIASPAHGAPASAGIDEVRAAIDRIVHYAGWTDKYQPLLGGVNPVSTPHFNFTITEPVGITGIIAPDAFPLLALLSLILPAIATGNTVVALASETNPCPAILFGEILAVSDLPGGVVNLLTGKRADLLPTFATHAHLRSLSAAVSPHEATLLQQGAAESVKRVTLHPLDTDWPSSSAQGLHHLRHHVELKTTWHPAAL